MCLSASLQTLLKDMIKLSWPASISSISTGTTGNKPSWSNISTCFDSKCKLNKGRRQTTRKSYLVSEKPFCISLSAPFSMCDVVASSVHWCTLKTGLPIHQLHHMPVPVFTVKLFCALMVETCKRFESWARSSAGISAWGQWEGTAEHQLNPGHGNTSNEGCQQRRFLCLLHTCKYTQAFVPLLFTCLIFFHKNHSIHPTQSHSKPNLQGTWFFSRGFGSLRRLFWGTGIHAKAQKLGSQWHSYAAMQWEIRQEESKANGHIWGSGGSVCYSGQVRPRNSQTLMQDSSHNISTALAQMSLRGGWGCVG